MHFRPVSIMAVVVGLACGACSSEDDALPDGGGSSTGADAGKTAADGGSPVAPSDGGMGSETSTNTASIAGKLTSMADLTFATKPLSGATVALFDAPSTSTLTGSDGAFTLGNVPVGEHVLSITMNDHWTEYYPVTVAAGGLTGLNRTLFTNGFFAAFFSSQSVTQDAMKGQVTVTFPDTGGHGATLSAQGDAPATIDAQGKLVSSPVLLAGGDTDLVFTNVTAGTTTVTLSGGGGKTCKLAQPSITSYPVAAQALTRILATCN